jgi:hypothetical protein
MKKIIVVGIAIVAYLFLLTSFKQTSTITGRVTPADGAESVWVMRDKDTTRQAINAGNFTVEVVPGIYKVFISAKTPFKNVYLENIEVKPDMSFDVGEIKLKP